MSLFNQIYNETLGTIAEDYSCIQSFVNNTKDPQAKNVLMALGGALAGCNLTPAQQELLSNKQQNQTVQSAIQCLTGLYSNQTTAKPATTQTACNTLGTQGQTTAPTSNSCFPSSPSYTQ